MRYDRHFALAGLMTAMAVFVGCQSETAPTASETSAADSQPAANAALASLPQEDQAMAAAQKFVCPVSGGPLGEMGPPVKVTVGDRSLLLCCVHCEEDAAANFDKYFAKAHGEPTADQ